MTLQDSQPLAQQFLDSPLPAELKERLAMLDIYLEKTDYRHLLKSLDEYLGNIRGILDESEWDHSYPHDESFLQPAKPEDAPTAIMRSMRLLCTQLADIAAGNSELDRDKQRLTLERAAGVFYRGALLFGGSQTGLLSEREYFEGNAELYVQNAMAYAMARAGDRARELASPAAAADESCVSADPLTWEARSKPYFYSDNVRDADGDSYYVLVFSPEINLKNPQLQSQICEAMATAISAGQVLQSQAVTISRSRKGNLMLTYRVIGNDDYVHLAMDSHHRESPPPTRSM